MGRTPLPNFSGSTPPPPPEGKLFKRKVLYTFLFLTSIFSANFEAKKTVKIRRVDNDSQAVHCKNFRTARLVSDWTENSSANSLTIYRKLNG